MANVPADSRELKEEIDMEKYTLEVIEQKRITPLEIIADLRNQSSEANHCLSESGTTGQSSKWYDCEEQMKVFSRDYPNHLFVVTKLGEDGRQWRFYIKNGKSQTAEMVPMFEPFDESELR